MTSQSLSLRSGSVNTSFIRMGEAATQFSISHSTLRKLDSEKRIICVRTPGNTRLVDVHSLRECLGLQNEKYLDKKVVGYCRCSTSKQKSDLERQVEKVRAFVLKKYGVEPTIYNEIGSGLSDSRKKYLRMIGEIVNGEVGTVVCYSSDRLSRYGNNVFKFLCENMGVELVFVEDGVIVKSCVLEELIKSGVSC